MHIRTKLDDEKPKDNIDTVEFKNFVPSTEEKEMLAEELSFHVALNWVDNLPYFGPYKTVLSKYIDHPYIKETKQKSERVTIFHFVHKADIIYCIIYVAKTKARIDRFSDHTFLIS